MTATMMIAMAEMIHTGSMRTPYGRRLRGLAGTMPA